jgi:glutamate carboxypeptidase
VVVRRKAAGTIRVTRAGAQRPLGSAPDRGRNALLALAAAAQASPPPRPRGPTA